MSEMIDRVTLTLAMSGAGCASAAAAQSVEACPYKVCQCRKAARAMAGAMREPTDEMIEAVAADYFPRVLPENRYAVISDCWRAMVDAALAD